ncbi:hypothetical protein HMH01_07535 [Halovulum dunhuangense]|uniref:Uncharacterized protein n=1 Tax=Halovulum dunhuangense TaxID=1505036 RepID=A0A849L210_9RHOB|nr:hypothetical protein [Halovulum dunhuangense]NNU80290.1 hypothetical protein [Halovulum dunhuangense]
MRLRSGYLLAGLAWALLLGPLLALGVLGTLMGVLWLHVFGDDPWPAAVDWAVPVLGVAILAATALGCGLFALRLGRRREALAAAGHAREWRRIALWTLEPVVDAATREAWPEHERQRRDQGETPLASRVTVPLPMAFTVRADGSIEQLAR